MNENGKTRRWVVAGVAMGAASLLVSMAGLLGPDGPWRSRVWRRRPRVVNLPELTMGGEISGHFTLKPVVLKGPAVAIATVRRPRGYIA